MHRNPVSEAWSAPLAFPTCAIPIVLQAVGVLFEIRTNGKGTTSSRAVPAPTRNSALAAGAASVLAAALLRLQRMDDELARAEAPLYASQSRERTETRGQTGRTPISFPRWESQTHQTTGVRQFVFFHKPPKNKSHPCDVQPLLRISESARYSYARGFPQPVFYPWNPAPTLPRA